ncbi:MAG: hypothetical protein RL417_2318 [Pseudomonadota bacterium]|jgi:short-subunit dehydrogenase
MKTIVIFGATSAIALGAARRWAERGDRFCLVGRDGEKLKTVADDLRVRGAAGCFEVVGDAADRRTHEEILARCFHESPDGIDIALVAYGVLPDQASAGSDPDIAVKALEVNFVSVAALLTRMAGSFEKAGRGTIAVITSVAGDRGRQSNYVYGAAKGGLGIFLGGLRNRLAPRGVNVVTIKPGFVDTPMTSHIKKGPLFASPDRVGEGIVRAIDRGASEVYLPWFWWVIMRIIRTIPEGIFKRLKL